MIPRKKVSVIDMLVLREEHLIVAIQMWSL